MATSPITQAALSSVAARSKEKGPRGAVAALVSQQQESQLQMQKLLQTIEKLQQENAGAVQQAAQAGGASATRIANQVARGMERDRAESQREQERAEDKDFAVQRQKLNTDLQKQAAREAATMGAAIQASREKYLMSVNTLKENDAKVDASLTGYMARVEEAARNGDFKGPEGAKDLQKIFDFAKQVKVYGDNMFNDSHQRAAFNEYNDRNRRMLKSDDPFAVLNMQTNPLKLPLPEMKGPRDKISPLSDLTPQQQFDLELMDGYPINGLFTGDKNFGLAEGEKPNVIHPATLIDLLQYDDVLRGLQDEGLRQELQDTTQKKLIETRDTVIKLKEAYDSLNTAFNVKALRGVEAALEDFVVDEDPAKMNDPGRYILTRSLTHTFGGGPQGEEVAQIALEFFDGKREPKSEHDFLTLAAVESASFNINFHLAAEVQNAADPAKGGSFATQLVSQMIETIGKDATLRSLGVDPSGSALVDAQAAVQDRVLEALGISGRMNKGMKSFSIYKQFKEQAISNIQQIDLQTHMITKDGERKEVRLGEMLNQLRRSPEEGGPTLEELQRPEGSEKQFAESMTAVGAFLDLYGSLGPDVAVQIAGVIANELDPVTSPDLKSYSDQIQVERQRSGYAKAAIDFSTFAYERTKRGKQKAQPVGEAFQEGGAAKVVAEQLPSLLSLAGRGMSYGVERTAVGLVQAAAGKGAAQSALENYRKGQGTIARTAARRLRMDDRDISNLTPEEREQVIGDQ